MNSVLLGNGINIQFGGLAYNSDFIMKRIKYASRLGKYDCLFGNKLTGTEIERMFNDFVPLANDIRLKNYDKYAGDNKDLKEALVDFQGRYNCEIKAVHEIMLEDWFLIIRMFFEKNMDLEEERSATIQGFEQLILDAIYNDGKIQELYKKMNKKVRKFFSSFDNIFSLNYDNNIENLTRKPVYHLHGDFSVLANSENSSNVQGYIRQKKGETVWLPEMKHCFCNALLNYSGKLKYKTATDAHALIADSETYAARYMYDENFREGVERLQEENPVYYELIMTKIQHPELNMATEYYFDTFKNITGKLSIIGMSPNNDDHIFDIILNNPNLKKVTFFYYSEKERRYVEDNFPSELFMCESVHKLWEDLNSKRPEYKCNYNIPNKAKDIINALNILSDDEIDFKRIKEEINKVPKFEVERLCRAVKEDMMIRNPTHSSTDSKGFIQGNASISYIALQEGILPSVLYLMCVMNFEYIQD
ncbi:MAG: hypothetical protein Q4D26_10845 [Clostridia bacterium]|nr:hypothetical protein [Clostridia bacterium]